MPLNADLGGKDYGETTYEVTAEAIEKFARATNDLNDRYLGTDMVAPPIFAVVPAFKSFMDASMDPELGADMLRLLHAAEEHVLYTPITPGAVLTVASVLESVDMTETGESFTIKVTETLASGEVAAEVRGTMFIRGSAPRGAARRPISEDEVPAEAEVVFEESTKVDDDQMVRYAEASGDRNPIHLDPAVARRAGLRRPILHGMCTMAIATKAAVNGLAGGDPTRVTRVAVRFSRPVLPGQELTTRLWPETEGEGPDRFGFATLNPDGKAVINNGQVEIR
jgi:acyl dehydratase